VIWSMDCRACG